MIRRERRVTGPRFRYIVAGERGPVEYVTLADFPLAISYHSPQPLDGLQRALPARSARPPGGPAPGDHRASRRAGQPRQRPDSAGHARRVPGQPTVILITLTPLNVGPELRPDLTVAGVTGR
jgi:hypothetical protein